MDIQETDDRDQCPDEGSRPPHGSNDDITDSERNPELCVNPTNISATEVVETKGSTQRTDTTGLQEDVDEGDKEHEPLPSELSVSNEQSSSKEQCKIKRKFRVDQGRESPLLVLPKKPKSDSSSKSLSLHESQSELTESGRESLELPATETDTEKTPSKRKHSPSETQASLEPLCSNVKKVKSFESPTSSGIKPSIVHNPDLSTTYASSDSQAVSAQQSYRSDYDIGRSPSSTGNLPRKTPREPETLLSNLCGDRTVSCTESTPSTNVCFKDDTPVVKATTKVDTDSDSVKTDIDNSSIPRSKQPGNDDDSLETQIIIEHEGQIKDILKDNNDSSTREEKSLIFDSAEVQGGIDDTSSDSIPALELAFELGGSDSAEVQGGIDDTSSDSVPALELAFELGGNSDPQETKDDSSKGSSVRELKRDTENDDERAKSDSIDVSNQGSLTCKADYDGKALAKCDSTSLSKQDSLTGKSDTNTEGDNDSSTNQDSTKESSTSSSKSEVHSDNEETLLRSDSDDSSNQGVNQDSDACQSKVLEKDIEDELLKSDSEDASKQSVNQDSDKDSSNKETLQGRAKDKPTEDSPACQSEVPLERDNEKALVRTDPSDTSTQGVSACDSEMDLCDSNSPITTTYIEVCSGSEIQDRPEATNDTNDEYSHSEPVSSIIDLVGNSNLPVIPTSNMSVSSQSEIQDRPEATKNSQDESSNSVSASPIIDVVGNLVSDNKASAAFPIIMHDNNSDPTFLSPTVRDAPKQGSRINLPTQGSSMFKTKIIELPEDEDAIVFAGDTNKAAKQVGDNSETSVAGNTKDVSNQGLPASQLTFTGQIQYNVNILGDCTREAPNLEGSAMVSQSEQQGKSRKVIGIGDNRDTVNSSILIDDSSILNENSPSSDPTTVQSSDDGIIIILNAASSESAIAEGTHTGARTQFITDSPNDEQVETLEPPAVSQDIINDDDKNQSLFLPSSKPPSETKNVKDSLSLINQNIKKLYKPESVSCKSGACATEDSMIAEQQCSSNRNRGTEEGATECSDNNPAKTLPELAIQSRETLSKHIGPDIRDTPACPAIENVVIHDEGTPAVLLVPGVVGEEENMDESQHQPCMPAHDPLDQQATGSTSRDTENKNVSIHSNNSFKDYRHITSCSLPSSSSSNNSNSNSSNFEDLLQQQERRDAPSRPGVNLRPALIHLEEEHSRPFPHQKNNTGVQLQEILRNFFNRRHQNPASLDLPEPFGHQIGAEAYQNPYLPAANQNINERLLIGVEQASDDNNQSNLRRHQGGNVNPTLDAYEGLGIEKIFVHNEEPNLQNNPDENINVEWSSQKQEELNPRLSYSRLMGPLGDSLSTRGEKFSPPRSKPIDIPVPMEEDTTHSSYSDIMSPLAKLKEKEDEKMQVDDSNSPYRIVTGPQHGQIYDEDRIEEQDRAVAFRSGYESNLTNIVTGTQDEMVDEDGKVHVPRKSPAITVEMDDSRIKVTIESQDEFEEQNKSVPSGSGGASPSANIVEGNKYEKMDHEENTETDKLHGSSGVAVGMHDAHVSSSSRPSRSALKRRSKNLNEDGAPSTSKRVSFSEDRKITLVLLPERPNVAISCQDYERLQTLNPMLGIRMPFLRADVCPDQKKISEEANVMFFYVLSEVMGDKVKIVQKLSCEQKTHWDYILIELKKQLNIYVEKKYKHDDGLVNLDILNYVSYQKMLDVIFPNGTVTSWQQIMELFAFCIRIAIRMVNLNRWEEFHQWYHWTVLYLTLHLSPMVYESGGWDMLRPVPDDEDTTQSLHFFTWIWCRFQKD